MAVKKIRGVRIDPCNVHASCTQCDWPSSGRWHEVKRRLERHLAVVHGQRDAEVAITGVL